MILIFFSSEIILLDPEVDLCKVPDFYPSQKVLRLFHVSIMTSKEAIQEGVLDSLEDDFDIFFIRYHLIRPQESYV